MTRKLLRQLTTFHVKQQINNFYQRNKKKQRESSPTPSHTHTPLLPSATSATNTTSKIMKTKDHSLVICRSQYQWLQFHSEKIQTNRMDIKTGFIIILLHPTPQKNQFNIKDGHYLKVKGWKIILQANGPKIPAFVAILMYT